MKAEMNQEQREHLMKCPVCAEWFDLRDLTMVFEHEHWMEQKPTISFSHAKLVGRENEVYIKVGKKMITMKQKK